MSLSSIATRGFLQGGSVSCVATRGFLCTGVVTPSLGSTGGNYKKTYRTLKSLEHYEERIREALAAEKREMMAEAKELRTRLIAVETEVQVKAKKQKLKAGIERELQILVIKEAIVQVDHELALLRQQALDVEHLARVLRDDEEILTLIATGVANGSI